MELNKTYIGDIRKTIRLVPDQLFDTIVTSTPYFQLRDYKSEGQIGLEETPKKFINELVKVFRIARKKLKETGSLWIVIGDTYYGGNTQSGCGSHNGKAVRSGTPPKKTKLSKLKPKDMIGIPWMLAFALRDDGWYLRQDLIWQKKNPMPESVTDRCTKSHEYIFLFSKSPQYYFDAEAIATEAQQWTGNAAVFGRSSAVSEHVIPAQSSAQHRPRKSGNKVRKNGSDRDCPEGSGSNVCSSVPWEGTKANKRSVWSVATKPLKDIEFYASYPQELIVDCIKAGCPEGGVVADLFHGSGTTGIVATKLGRNYVGFEINPKNIKIEEKRRRQELGMFSQP